MTPYYFERERAALGSTEAVRLVSVDQVPDDVYEVERRTFNEKELADLTAAIVTINAWNRLAIAFRTTPETFQLVVRSPDTEETKGNRRAPHIAAAIATRNHPALGKHLLQKQTPVYNVRIAGHRGCLRLSETRINEECGT